jgi:predicted amidophosphoribosyltransferase
MSSDYLTCSSCRKANLKGDRYCIQCGSILSPVYCSSCGTKNPDGLEQCLECGATLPSLVGFHWVPIVTVLNPTSAMTETRQRVDMVSAGSSSFKWLRSKIDRGKKSNGSTASSASNHT